MNIEEYIKPLNINGLNGRMLVLPASSRSIDRQILLLYGHHSSLERMAGIAEDMAQYGTVTMPDFPGFGGMDSMYKVGLKPSIDTIADYLAAFIKLRYKNKKITIIGMSFGFVVATRMLQKYPKLVHNIDLLVSVVGFCHKDDFAFTRTRFIAYKTLSRIFSLWLPSLFFRAVALHPTALRFAYAKTHNAKNKFKGLSKQEIRRAMDFEIRLWHTNDLRTHMYTTVEMFTLDNCKRQIALPVHHISVGKDQYFVAQVVEQHMRVIFTDFTQHTASMNSHAPSIIADKQAAAKLVPKSLRKILAQGPTA